MRWRKISAAIAAVAVIATVDAALDRRGAQGQAELWPQRLVRIIRPYAAGGNSDGMARLGAQRLGAAFGQSFAVGKRSRPHGAFPTAAVAPSSAAGFTAF